MSTRPTPPTGDAEQQLADRLTAHASHLHVGGRPVAEVMSRGRHRQHRRRTAVGIAAVVGITGGTIASVNVLTRPADQSVAGSDPSMSDAPAESVATPVDTVSPTVAPAVPVAPIELVESNLVWNVVEPGSAEALGMTTISGSGVVGDGPYLAWSTAPGRTDSYSPVLWRSDDGQRWSLAADPPPVSPVGLASLDDRFIAFGTMPSPTPTASDRAVDAALAVSDDGGGSWRTIDLPLDLASLSDDRLVTSVGTSAAAIATGDAGVLLAVRVNANLDWQVLLPADVFANGSWTTTPTGVRVAPNHPCTVVETTIVAQGPGAATVNTTPDVPVGTATANTTPDVPVGTPPPTVPGRCTDETRPEDFVTWDELGVAPATAAVMSGSYRFFLATDGERFEEFAAPVPADGWAIGDMKLVGYAGGFAAFTSQYDAIGQVSRSMLYSSPDASSWNELGESPVQFVESFAAMGDRLVVYGSSGRADGTVVTVREPTGEWTITNLNSMLRPDDGVKAYVFATGPAIGPTGITVAGSIFKDPVAEIGGVETTSDGITVRAEDAGATYVVLDANSGTELGRITNGSEASGLLTTTADGEGFDVRLVDGGPVVTTFTWHDLNAMLESTYALAEPPKGVVLHSTDGINWSRESIDDIAGEAVTNSGARVIGSQVIIAVNRTSTIGATGATGVPEQILLIGTPAG